MERKKKGRSISEIDLYLKHHDSLTTSMLLASLHNRNGDYRKAIDVLQKAQKAIPFNADIAYDLIDNHYQMDHHQEVLTLCEALIQNKLDTADTYYYRGRSEYELKSYMKAKASFEEALKRSPSDKDSKEFLDLVSGMMGEGSNTIVKKPIDPVAISAEFKKTVSENEKSVYLKGFGAYYLCRIRGIFFKKNQPMKTTEYYQIKILDAKAMEKFNEFEFSFDPLSEEIYVNDLKVKNQAGKVVSTLKPADYYVVDDKESDQATQDKVLHVEVAGLAPGNMIELTVTRRDLQSSKTMSFVKHTFSRSFPVLRDTLFIEGDLADVKFVASGGLKAERTSGSIYWTREKSPVYEWEDDQPPYETYLPNVWIGSELESWDKLVQVYYAKIRDRVVLDQNVKNVALKLTKGAQREQDKVKALVEFVRNEFTYKAIEFGVRARIPNKVADIIRNKYGDCKDHALLLYQLLEASGIAAQLALVNTDGAVQQTIPSLDQFNHMIVYLPAYKNGFFIDATDKYSGLNLVPVTLGGKDVLLISEYTGSFVKIPQYPADSSKVTSGRTVRVVNSGTAFVEETLSLEGYHASFLRGYLSDVKESERLNSIQGLLSREDSTVRFQNLNVRNLTDRERPLILEMKYLLSNRFHNIENQIVGRIPALWERYYLTVEQDTQRVSPFELIYPIVFESSVMLIPPIGYSLESIHETTEKYDQKFAHSTALVRKVNGNLQIEYKNRRASGSFGPQEYALCQKNLEDSVQLVTQKVGLVKRR